MAEWRVRIPVQESSVEKAWRLDSLRCLRKHEGEGGEKGLNERPSIPWNESAGYVRGLGNTIFGEFQKEPDLNMEAEDMEHANHHAVIQEASQGLTKGQAPALSWLGLGLSSCGCAPGAAHSTVLPTIGSSPLKTHPRLTAQLCPIHL